MYFTKDDENKKIFANTYDEIGRLISKEYYATNGTSVAKKIDYSYNIRDWLGGIDGGSQFSEEIGYTGDYTGNVTNATYTYNTGIINNSYDLDYTYDGTNRLTSVENTGDPASEYNEALSFDQVGRITQKRKGASTLNGFNQFYTYDGLTNKLNYITNKHNAGNYSYDDYGNMVSDKSKKMDEVLYDWRDMPVRFNLKETGETWNSSVDIVYDAAGNRVLKKERVEINGAVTRAKAVAYAGSDMVFENDNYIAEQYSLKYFNIDQEGRMDFPSLTNYYYIKDHLGSTRMVVNESGEAIEANMYDSYGKLSQLVYSGTSSRLREKFTGKEFDDDGAVAGETNGLGLYYFGKRYYDPEIGTFTTKDPQDQSWNSYSYCYGDPLNLVDPDGEEAYFKVPVGYNLYKPAEVFLDLPVIGTNKNIASPLATTLGGGFAASLFVFEAIAMAGQNLKNAAPSSNNQYSSDEVYTGPGGETDVTGVNKYPVISEQIEMDPFNVMTDVLDEGSLQREMSFLELNEELSDPMNYIGGIGKGGKLLSKAASLGAKAVKLGLNASSPTSKIIVENLGMKTSDFIAKYRKASINSVFPSEYKSMTVEEALQKGGSSVRKLLTDARFAK